MGKKKDLTVVKRSEIATLMRRTLFNARNCKKMKGSKKCEGICPRWFIKK